MVSGRVNEYQVTSQIDRHPNKEDEFDSFCEVSVLISHEAMPK